MRDEIEQLRNIISVGKIELELNRKLLLVQKVTFLSIMIRQTEKHIIVVLDE